MAKRIPILRWYAEQPTARADFSCGRQADKIVRNPCRARSTAPPMLIDHHVMRGWVLGVVALTACTKPNPRSCADDFCEDPAFPFCDVDGALEGVPNACVAVDCEPGTFVACRGTSQLSCNAEGTNIEVTRCEEQCDENLGCTETRVPFIVFS